MRAAWSALLVSMLAGEAAPAAHQTLLVAVGNNHGLSHEEPLRFAEQDAQKMAALMSELGGVSVQRAYVLSGQGPQAVEKALIEIKGRAAELKQEGKRVHLLFYYAGHGDRDHLHLAGQRLDMETLSGWLAQVRSDLRVLFIDSCQTTGASRVRGVERVEPFAIFARVNPVHGTIVIRSASAGEPAQESDELGGAVFSHYLMSGLRGPADVDGDKRVTLDEAYAFAYTRTLLRTASASGSVQHPAFEYQIDGSGPVVVTYMRRASAELVFPSELDVTYMVFGLPDGSLVAEVGTNDARPTALAVPAGRFLVHRRASDAVGLTRVDLPWGGSKALDPNEFDDTEYQSLAVRGGHIDVRTLQVSAGYRAAGWPGRNQSLGHGVSLAAETVLAGWSVDLHVDFVRLPLALNSYQGSELRLGVRPSVNVIRLGTTVRFRGGLGLALQPIWQDLHHRQSDTLESAEIDSNQTLFGLGFGPHLHLDLSVAVVPFVTVGAQATYTPLLLQVDDGNRRELSVQHELGLGIQLSYAFQ